jgi:hypothetical protein
MFTQDQIIQLQKLLDINNDKIKKLIREEVEVEAKKNRTEAKFDSLKLETKIHDLADDIKDIKLDTIRLGKQIDTTQKSLEEQIDATQKSLEEQIDATQKSLEEQIDATQKSLGKQIDTLQISIDIVEEIMVKHHGLLEERVKILEKNTQTKHSKN